MRTQLLSWSMGALLAAPLAASAAPIDAKAVSPTAAPAVSSEPSPAASAAAAPASTPPMAKIQADRFSLGVGYPDLRARYNLGHGVDIEAKFAIGSGVQVYSGRLYWNFYDLGPVKIDLGGEAGMARFDAVETLSGTGTVFGGFVGLEYPFAKRFKVTADIGPVAAQASASGQSISSTDVVYNTALYFFLF